MLVKAVVSIHALELFPFRRKMLDEVSIELRLSCLRWVYEVVSAWVTMSNAVLSLWETQMSILRENKKTKWLISTDTYINQTSNVDSTAVNSTYLVHRALVSHQY